MAGLKAWGRGINPDPAQRTFGDLKRKADGSFEDAELVALIQQSTEDVAGKLEVSVKSERAESKWLLGAFGARNVPAILKAVEILGIQQARKWKVATLNEVRTFFKLKPHATFCKLPSLRQNSRQKR